MSAQKVTCKNKNGEAKNSWACIFRLKLPDGQVSKISKQGFKTKKEAELWERAERERITLSLSTPTASNLTIEKLCQRWLSSAKNGSGERPPVEHMTWKDYDLSVRVHIAPRIGNQFLVEFDAPAAVIFRKQLLNEVSRAKAQRILKHLRQALNFAVESGYILANPTLAVKIARSVREKAQPKIPTRTEMQSIVAELICRAEDKSEKWTKFATLFIVLRGTGLRISEARGLSWDAVNLDDAVLEVRQRIDQNGKMGPVKSAASKRIVVLDRYQIEWLRRWQPLCPKGEFNLVFPNGMGKPMAYSNLFQQLLKPVCQKLGLVTAKGTPLFSFHAARHYRVSELIASGANVREIMGEVGHASSALTLDLYGHLFPEDLARRRERAEKISGNLSGLC